MFTHALKTALVTTALVFATFLNGCAQEDTLETDGEAQVATQQDAITATVETPANQCAANQQMDGGLCYPTCKAGFWGQITRCIESCGHQHNGGWESSPGVCAYRVEHQSGWTSVEHFTPNSYDRGAGTLPNSCPSGFVKVGNKCKPQPGNTGTGANTGANSGGTGSNGGNGGPTPQQTCVAAGKYWSQEQQQCFVYNTLGYYKALCEHNGMEYSAALQGTAMPCVTKASPELIGNNSQTEENNELPCEVGLTCQTDPNPKTWDKSGVINSYEWVEMEQCATPDGCI